MADNFLVRDPSADLDPLETVAEADLDPVSILDPSNAASDLETLRADMAKEILEEVALPVPSRPGYEAVHVADISGELINDLRRRAKDRKQEGGVDPIRLVSNLLVATNVAIRKDGRRLVDDDGEALTYRSAEFLEIMGETSAARAVRKFYLRDGELTSAANALMTAAGWGESLEIGSVENENPTPRRR